MTRRVVIRKRIYKYLRSAGIKSVGLFTDWRLREVSECVADGH